MAKSQTGLDGIAKILEVWKGRVLTGFRSVALIVFSQKVWDYENMKTSKNDLTLDNIGKLIDRKLAPVITALGGTNGEIRSLNTKVVGIYGELDGLKQQISGVEDNLGARIDSVDTKLEVFRKETGKNFSGVYDGLEGLAETLDRSLEPRVKRLENKVFAQQI